MKAALWSICIIARQNFSHGDNVVSDGSPSRIRRVLLISFGMTILPRSSTRRTMPVAFIILFSFEARDARFAPVEVFAGKGELCMGAAAIFFSGCVSFNSKATWQGSPWNTAGRNNSGFRWTLSVGYGKIIASVPNKGGQWKMAISKAIPHRKKCQKPPSVI